MDISGIENQSPFNKKARIAVMLSSALVVLLLQHFLSASGVAGNYIASFSFFESLSYDFSYVIGWGVFTIAIYLIIPLATLAILKEPFSNYGLSLGKGGGYIYLIAPFLILPVTYIVSINQEFQNTYPFLHNPGSIQEFLCWELIYAFQFLALEFFFRGFIFKSIIKFTPLYPAILLATIPYTLIHFVKPVPEAISSFFGGVILCWIAIRYKSIAIGLYLHLMLAVSMDIFTLYHRGWFNLS